ncbi:MAG: hypothetical protein HFJ80_05510 [Clostridiales bacterium]|nr:hypothetical protein [Clostridiales bacterium]
MRKAAVRLAALLSLFCLLGGHAAAQPNDQRAFVLITEGEVGMTQTVPEEPAFWEYPQLPAGQRRTGGILRLVNHGERTASMSLTEIALPYGNDELLAYLGHVRITVAERERATASAEDIAALLSTAAATEETESSVPAEGNSTEEEPGSGITGEETAGGDSSGEGTSASADPAEPAPADAAGDAVSPEPTVAAADEVPPAEPPAERILYDGAYSHIADEDGLKIEIPNMQPGEVREYTVTLQCDFTFEGDAALLAMPIPWRFSASSSYTVIPERPSFWSDPLMASLLCAAGALLIVIGAAAAVRAVWRKRKRAS